MMIMKNNMKNKINNTPIMILIYPSDNYFSGSNNYFYANKS